MTRTAFRNTPRGFTLIELMVGLVIGLIATIVIAQVLVVSEGRRRTTVSGSDAQVSGALSMYAVQREVQMAGYGLGASTAGLGCTIKAQYNSVDKSSLFGQLAPILITQGASGQPDSIQILTSGKPSYSVPVRVATDHPKTASTFFVNTNLGSAVGDLLVAVPPAIDANNWCSIFQVSSLTGSTQINHVTGTNGAWNQSGGSSISPTSGYAATTVLVNLGPVTTRTLSISANNTLQVTTFNSTGAATATEDLYPDVVNLKALYAKDTDSDGLVDTYDNVTPTTAAGWQQVKGIRLAVVTRSAQMEKDNVTAANPLWDVGTSGTVAGSATCGSSNCVTLKVDGGTNWQQYRFKVYDTFVPLRNLLWQS
jgi:type IV pilus assembly protein PilW